MTEAEWLTCVDPTPMLEFAQRNASDRKLKLFAVACCRTARSLLIDRRSQQAVATAERDADGQVDHLERIGGYCDAVSAANPIIDRSDHHALAEQNRPYYVQAAVAVVELSSLSRTHSRLDDAKLGRVVKAVIGAKANPVTSALAICSLLRDVGNPFRPVAVDPAWLTSTVVALAEGIYQDRAFDRMPILADALQDAGCDDEAVLNHCRGETVHVRGCWVVDLLTGRK